MSKQQPERDLAKTRLLFSIPQVGKPCPNLLEVKVRVRFLQRAHILVNEAVARAQEPCKNRTHTLEVCREPFALLWVYYCYGRRKRVVTCEAELMERVCGTGVEAGITG